MLSCGFWKQWVECCLPHKTQQKACWWTKWSTAQELGMCSGVVPPERKSYCHAWIIRYWWNNTQTCHFSSWTEDWCLENCSKDWCLENCSKPVKNLSRTYQQKWQRSFRLCFVHPPGTGQHELLCVVDEHLWVERHKECILEAQAGSMKSPSPTHPVQLDMHGKTHYPGPCLAGLCGLSDVSLSLSQIA